ncbi:hypothetical protein [Pseudoalteromonas luteoviolacea]|uniref:Uncharacterized protein n=1 Tax=Pseudoalteromonas luteoviolacea S4060-1 TaxID=1365257 RepID=A0A167KVE3_9GAMM|nr:hypothetical protein [Pseudoalteromonas luteoviolacea]KZN63341.1 hypothetical protein N478_03565 [Pseudoalteromonas luteoviolacea S4060-1]
MKIKNLSIIISLVFLSFLSFAGKDEQTVYEISVAQGKKLEFDCPHSDSNPNYYCASLMANSINQYFSFCRWLVKQSNSELDFSKNPEICKQATVSQFNEWVNHKNRSIHAELDNLKLVVWPKLNSQN